MLGVIDVSDGVWIAMAVVVGGTAGAAAWQAGINMRNKNPINWREIEKCFGRGDIRVSL
jgi:hypothetical protein